MKVLPVKIPSQSVAFDIDGVCANTVQLFIDIASSHYQMKVFSPSQITQYSFFKTMNLSDEDILQIIEKIVLGKHTEYLYPIMDAFNVLNMFSHPILFVTARTSGVAISAWISHFLVASNFEIIATKTPEAKKEILRERNIAYFMEDHLQTCYELAEVGIVPILFAQPWNRVPHPFLEVTSWREFFSLLDVA